jgi:hypothetical protein
MWNVFGICGTKWGSRSGVRNDSQIAGQSRLEDISSDRAALVLLSYGLHFNVYASVLVRGLALRTNLETFHFILISSLLGLFFLFGVESNSVYYYWGYLLLVYCTSPARWCLWNNRCTRRKPALVPFCPPQTPHDLTRARTWVTAVGSQVSELFMQFFMSSKGAELLPPGESTWYSQFGGQWALQEGSIQFVYSLFMLLCLLRVSCLTSYVKLGALTWQQRMRLCSVCKPLTGSGSIKANSTSRPSASVGSHCSWDKTGYLISRSVLEL